MDRLSMEMELKTQSDTDVIDLTQESSEVEMETDTDSWVEEELRHSLDAIMLQLEDLRQEARSLKVMIDRRREKKLNKLKKLAPKPSW